MALAPEKIIVIREPSLSSGVDLLTGLPIIPARVGDLIELSGEYLKVDRLGESFNLARALLVLHWLAIEAQTTTGSTLNSGGGLITQIQENKLSVSFGSSGGSTISGLEFLDSTAYGKELAALIARTITCCMVAVDILIDD